MSGADKAGQYRRKAQGWSEREYADGRTYLERRADLIVSLGTVLQPGDEVLDLACGDGALGEALVLRGLRYRGVDVTEEMVVEARRRLGTRAVVELGDLNDYMPPDQVVATTVFRAVYYARDRRAFFGRVASYTTTKLLLDLNPRQYRVDDVVGDLRAAGFDRVALRPFFVPQRVALPRLGALTLRGAEQVGPLARLALRFRFTYLVSAYRSS